MSALINNLFKKKKEKIIEISDNISNLFPAYIDNTKFNYIKFDDKYSGSIIIIDYPNHISLFELTEAISKNIQYEFSMYIKKQDTQSILKELTYHIASNGTEINTISKNQIDFELINRGKNDAIDLRREIQINNEEIFLVNIIITVYNKDKEQLLNDIKSIKSKFYSKQFISSIANFRHLNSYISTLPLINFEGSLSKSNYRNFTTSSLANTFPLYQSNIIDQNGIIFGYFDKENSICSLDIFSQKHMNSNICIFGSSGSGKSFFTKLLIIRNFFKNINQYIFDPEGEYSNIANKFNCEVIKFSNKDTNKYINILQITEEEILINSFDVIKYKVGRVTNLICEICNISNDQERLEIEITIYNAYKTFKINCLDSLYKEDSNNKIYINKKIKDSYEFPLLSDAVKKIRNSKLKNIILSEFLDKFPCFQKHTNIDYNSKIVVFDIANVEKKYISIISKYLLEWVNNKLYFLKKLNEENKSLIYIDEIWKLIAISENSISEDILSMFKSIRKRNAGIVTITQDISDFFSYNQGIYGKGVLNNSTFKIFFKIDYSDVSILNNLSDFDSDMIKRISRLHKAECKIIFENNIFNLNVIGTNYELKLIGGNK